MKMTIDFWCDQILIWSACLWAHQKFSEILSPGPAPKPSSCSVVKGWENNLSVNYVYVCIRMYIRLLSVQDNIQEHYRDTAPTSNLSEHTRSCRCFSHKTSVGLFQSFDEAVKCANPAPWATWCHQYFGKYSRSPGSKVTSKGFRWAKRSNPQINRRCLHWMTHWRWRLHITHDPGESRCKSGASKSTMEKESKGWSIG